MSSGRGACGSVGGDPVVGPFERMGARGLDGVDPRRTAERAKRRGLLQRLGAGTGEGAPAHLHDDVVERVTAAGQGGDDLVAERLATLDRQPVLVALAGERYGAAVEFAAQPQVRGIARGA